MLQLLPSFSRLSLGSLSRRRRAPTGADDDGDDTDEARASQLLMLLSQGSAPGPSQPGPSQPASLTRPQVYERARRLSQTPGAIYARGRRAAQREEEEGNRQPTARKKNRNLGNNVPWLDWETHRLRFFLEREKEKTDGNGPIDFKALEARFNQGLLDGEKRSENQIKGKIREWNELAGDDHNDNKVTRTRWSKEEVERLTEIFMATPKRADGLPDLKEIVRRYNQGLDEADRREKAQIGRKLLHINKPRVPAGAGTNDPDDPEEGAGA